MAKESQPHAFVMICCESGNHEGNLETLRNMPEVQEVHAVYGVYDEMARIKTDTMEEFKKINSKIRALPNIRSTITMFIE
jgi:DNA-binding Lrp family transcriptional regulator